MSAYPVPEDPAVDPRGTFGLVVDVAEVIERHGYPPVAEQDDHLRLRMALYRFLYGDPE